MLQMRGHGSPRYDQLLLDARGGAAFGEQDENLGLPRGQLMLAGEPGASLTERRPLRRLCIRVRSRFGIRRRIRASRNLLRMRRPFFLLAHAHSHRLDHRLRILDVDKIVVLHHEQADGEHAKSADRRHQADHLRAQKARFPQLNPKHLAGRRSEREHAPSHAERGRRRQTEVVRDIGQQDPNERIEGVVAHQRDDRAEPLIAGQADQRGRERDRGGDDERDELVQPAERVVMT